MVNLPQLRKYHHTQKWYHHTKVGISKKYPVQIKMGYHQQGWGWRCIHPSMHATFLKAETLSQHTFSLPSHQVVTG